MHPLMWTTSLFHDQKHSEETFVSLKLNILKFLTKLKHFSIQFFEVISNVFEEQNIIFVKLNKTFVRSKNAKRQNINCRS